jgi:uncharacterized OB-fold protein
MVAFVAFFLVTGSLVLLLVGLLCKEMATRWRREEEQKRLPKTRKETKTTCKACGHVWYYGQDDVKEQLLIAVGNLTRIQEKRVIDFKKCPKCGSRAVLSEEVVWEE